MTGIIQRYQDLRTHQDRDRTIDLQTRLGRMDKIEMERKFAGSSKLGNVFLFDSPGTPNCVMELIANPGVGDSVAILYEAHPVFNTIGDYKRAREELIDTVNDFAEAGTLGVLVFCPVRRRPTHVRDLGIEQLLQIIRGRVAAWAGKRA